MVAKICDSSLLKTCTICRSDWESSNLKTYVPAGRTWAPTPGISIGWLNVMVVFLFEFCASAVPENIMQTTLVPKANSTARFKHLDRFRPNITTPDFLSKTWRMTDDPT